MSQAMKALLLSPFSFPSKVKYPQVAMAYLIALLSVTFLGLAVSAGVPVKPVIVGCAIIGTWGTLMAVLVMSASVAGIPLSWTEGSRFISLAGMPLLFKMIGALVMSAWTTLSPFYYTSSPALFLKSSPTWVERLDLFEIWTVFLVWILISRRPSSNPKKSILVTAVVWVAAMALSVALQKLGGGA